MKTRATLALAVMAGLPAAVVAQEVMQVTYSWLETQGNSTVLATGPLAGNSVVDEGEGALIRIGVTALINGTNAVGQTTNYTNPAPGGVGTVRGLGAVVYDLVGNGDASSANGTWSNLLGPGAPLGTGSSPGNVQPGGSSVHGFGGSQFTAPQGSVNPTNNNFQLFRGVWKPTDYTSRTVNFLTRTSVLVPAGQGSSVLLAYGQDSAIDPNTEEPFTFDLLVGKFFAPGVGNGLGIPVAPAPSSLALLGLGALVAGGRRRKA